jgi:D-alanyl-D-alanine carboxypeptidase
MLAAACLTVVGLVTLAPASSGGPPGGWPSASTGRSTAAGTTTAPGHREPTSAAVAPPAAPSDPVDAGLGRVARSDVPPCTFGDVQAPHGALDEWASTIVDTEHALPGGYVPPDLVPVASSGIGGWGLVRSFVIDDLGDLAAAASAAGHPLAVQSAYRSRSRQAQVFADWVRQSGEADARRFSARAGHSEHQLGTAVDLRAADGGAPWTGGFATSPTGHWVAAHAVEFGFVLSYPAGGEAATCYGAEAWHLRYVGRARAAEVAASGLTLREWLFTEVGP